MKKVLVLACILILTMVLAIAAPVSAAGVVFYKDANYLGTATQPIPPGSYSLSQLQSYGFVNDWASSVKTGGYTVVMYSDDGWHGNSWTLTADTSNFTTLSPNANDKVTSCTIYPASGHTHDLVLLHGLSNKHRWSDEFLDRAAYRWGSGNVYVIFTNSSTRVWTRVINGRTIYFCGENDYSAGDGSVATQTALMRTKILLLQASYGLSSPFDLIGHSMGGLVGRYYVWQYPYTVSGLVTLGTPHHGSSLATDAKILSYFIGAEAAFDNLKPSWVNNTFNTTLAPFNGMPFADGGLRTITGDADGTDCWGWGGELFVGWPILSIQEGDNDGLVSHQSSMVSGVDNHNGDANSISGGFFWDFDHNDLVTNRSVLDRAAYYLKRP